MPTQVLPLVWHDHSIFILGNIDLLVRRHYPKDNPAFREFIGGANRPLLELFRGNFPKKILYSSISARLEYSYGSKKEYVFAKGSKDRSK